MQGISRDGENANPYFHTSHSETLTYSVTEGRNTKSKLSSSFFPFDFHTLYVHQSNQIYLFLKFDLHYTFGISEAYSITSVKRLQPKGYSVATIIIPPSK